MSLTSAFQMKIRTDSSDENGILLLAGGQLVAILVELADESHGEERGKWAIEATFGVDGRRHPSSFATAADAADWVSNYICEHPFSLSNITAHLT